MADSRSLPELWAEVIASLFARGDLSQMDLAFAKLGKPLGIIDETLLIAVPSTMVKDRMETRMRGAFLETLAAWPGQEVQRFAVTVDPSLEDAVSDVEIPPAGGSLEGPSTANPVEPGADSIRPLRTGPAATGPFSDSEGDLGAGPVGSSPLGGGPLGGFDPASGHSNGVGAGAGGTVTPHPAGPNTMPLRPTRPTPLEADPARLNPKYTFETFVIGASNRFANAAARAVAEAPARAYNPLFIYGGSGLGKTHLLHAIGHYARNLMPDMRVRYVNSEEFTNDFINSIRDDKAERFQRRYRNVDVLLVDDIQFLGGKEQTVEEFFHTFNSLHNDQKQVVITSDMPPKKLQGFEERLISRFEWGLLTDVQPPDLETRIAILRKKAQAENLQATDEVLSFIASRISTNIRELEGALIRVTAFANLNRQPVELSLAELVLRDLVTDADLQEITPALIIKETSEYFNISVDVLCSPDRSRVVASARQIAMYLCRELTELSLPKIGQTFGGRDHTTVMYAYRKIAEQMSEKRAIYNQVTELTNRIKQNARNAKP